MLSQNAHTIATILMTCPCTVHDLQSVTAGTFEYDDQVLLAALAELSQAGYIEWTLEPDYHGHAPPVWRRSFSDVNLRRDWRLCFGPRGPKQPQPDGDEATLFVYVTDAMLHGFDPAPVSRV